ncbi:hypothetical protein EYF80_008733 [Liparis tanakae]|uniref:Uncharacterized protein n=1 Tax=Liparis tanakae TaxID=230148 RepID=A0A4Z2ITK0_9TELE|nr:hypothetical protein EYF80_008733 [Liparis tanakae]
MLADFSLCLLSSTETLGRVLRQELEEEEGKNGDGLPRETLGVEHALLHDGLEQLLLVNTVKRWLGGKERKGKRAQPHFIQQYSIGPPVYRFIIGLVRHNLKRVERKGEEMKGKHGSGEIRKQKEDGRGEGWLRGTHEESPGVSLAHDVSAGVVYLRGDVVGGATEGARGVLLQHALPAHPKVRYLDVALAVKQHIIQLQIPEKEEPQRDESCRWITSLEQSLVTKDMIHRCRTMSDEQPTSLPVDDALAVEEEEADRYLRCIKPAGREEKEEPHCRLLYLSEK